MIFRQKLKNSSHSEVKTSPRSFPISQSSVTAPTASVSSITSSEHSVQWDRKFFEVEYLKSYKTTTIKQNIFYASLEWINMKYYISLKHFDTNSWMVQKFECNFVKCLNPMCSAVVYTGCIWYKKVPVVATEKRTDVWSRDFKIWKINSGLWNKRVWADYEQIWGLFF